MEALKKLAVPKAKVLRRGLKKIAAFDFVPGDVIFLEAGEKAPADARIEEAIDLTVDESILTGEFVPREKFMAPIEGEVAIADAE